MEMVPEIWRPKRMKMEEKKKKKKNATQGK